MAVVALAVLVYGGAIVYLRMSETSLVYQPRELGGGAVKPLPDSLHLVSERLQLVSADGTRLAGIIIPATDTAAQWLLYLHGNAGNVTSSLLPRFYARVHALGLNVAAIDYRGYGDSEKRTPSEAGLYADARALYEWLHTVKHVASSRIIIYGHSLGSGPATELALRVEASGLILEGAFTSVPDRGAEMYPWLPVHWVATQRFANIEKIGYVALPKLLMHARDDSIIPYEHGLRLFEAASAPKQWVELKGGHMRAFLDDSAQFWGRVGEFTQRLRTDLPAGESPLPSAR
jgi:fermentation-respiration switch protein FrsA (DUF1100 family)